MVYYYNIRYDVLTALLDGKHLRPRLVNKTAPSVVKQLEKLKFKEQSDLLKPNKMNKFAKNMYKNR